MALLAHTPKIFNSLNSPSEIIYSNEMQQLKPLKLLHSNPTATTTFGNKSASKYICTMMRNSGLFIVVDQKGERQLKSTQTSGTLIGFWKSFQRPFSRKKESSMCGLTKQPQLDDCTLLIPLLSSEKWNNPCGLLKGVCLWKI